jgi:hypothetical protein
MKTTIISIATLLFSTVLTGQTVDSQSQGLIETFVKNNVTTEIEPVDPAAVGKVFTGKFFRIMVNFIETGAGASSCGDYNYININGTTVTMTEGFHTDMDCPVLLSMVKPDFLLKDENSAKIFEEALNVLYPVEERERQNMKHMKKGAQWLFVRKKFFDDFTVFFVTVAPNGKVTKIDARLGYTIN